MSSTGPGTIPSVSVFLSHRYKSPAINSYFSQLLGEEMEVQFEVDKGTSSTNVTRLERLMRRVDAFVGVYSLDPDLGSSPPPAELRSASQYFRLELDLAIRSAKPGLVFCDRRLSQVLPRTGAIRTESFDHAEFSSDSGSPHQAAYKRAIEDFRREVLLAQETRAAGPRARHDKVGILVPSAPEPYSEAILTVLEDLLREAGIERISKLSWPARLDARMFEALDELNWAIADTGPASMASGLAGFLHGRFLPMLRLYPGDRPENLDDDAGLRSLFGGVEVGYSKDIVFWRDVEELKAGVRQRLPSVLLRRPEIRRISTAADAREYFASAALRKETVFLSYSGRDVSIASVISEALKARFQQVFDYKDGASIRPGRPWLAEIFDQLATAAIGVPLVSGSYLESGNCLHEAENMVAARDSADLTLMPVKLYPDDIEDGDRPTWMTNIQYHHWYSKHDAGALVKAIEAAVDDPPH